MKKQIIATTIILLFIGISVAPSINLSVAKASNDNDLVEVTTQACGIKGFGNTTVKLTREQYQNLEQYLVDFRERLNQTTTREEAVPIFKEAVVELDKYGLLPKGMSVERAQMLVTGWYQNLALNGNYLCLITGNASNTMFIGLPLRPLINVYILIYKFFNIFPNFPFRLLSFIDYFLCGLIMGAFILDFWAFQNLNLFNYIIFGVYTQGDHWSDSSPSEGWVDSYGLLGKRQWNNSFFGNILPITSGGGYGYGGLIEYYIGGVGFTGIALSSGFFLGTTLHVDLIQA